MPKLELAPVYYYLKRQSDPQADQLAAKMFQLVFGYDENAVSKTSTGTSPRRSTSAYGFHVNAPSTRKRGRRRSTTRRR